MRFRQCSSTNPTDCPGSDRGDEPCDTLIDCPGRQRLLVFTHYFHYNVVYLFTGSDNFSFQNYGIKKCTCWKTMGFSGKP